MNDIKKLEEELWETFKDLGLEDGVYNDDRSLLLAGSVLMMDALKNFDEEDYVLYFSGLDAAALDRIESRKKLFDEFEQPHPIPKKSLEKGKIRRTRVAYDADNTTFKGIYKTFLCHEFLQNKDDKQIVHIVNESTHYYATNVSDILKFLRDQGIIKSLPNDERYDYYARSPQANRPVFKVKKEKKC